MNSSITGNNRELEEILRKCKVIKEQLELFIKKENEENTENEAIDKFISENSLALIVGTICDEKIKAETAWSIPYYLNEFLKQKGLEFKPSAICKLGKEELRNWIASYMQGKWPKTKKFDCEEWLNKISESIINTCEKILKEYNDDPYNIFTINDGSLSVPIVYFIFRQFPGIGPKKASMIAREFGSYGDWFKSVKARLQRRGINLNVSYPYFTEIPIDIHVRRVFQRLGFVRYIEPQDFQNLARMIYPENPGLVDLLIWEIGRERCKKFPKCERKYDICPLSSVCDYYNQIYKGYKHST